MEYKNLVVVGTSHIAKQSIDEVKNVISFYNPEIIALELDQKRLPALMQKKHGRLKIRDIRKVGFKGFIFSLIGEWAEKKLGERVNIKPGSEMKAAFKIARKKGIKVALIDQDIEITLKKFSKELSWREKFNFLIDIFKSIILRKNVVDFDLTKVPDKKIISKLIKKVKKRYPNIYNVLIRDRNKVMARNLYSLINKNPEKRIVAIVGAGHEEEIIKIIKRLEKTKADVVYRFSVS